MRYLPTGAQMKQGDQKTITEMGMPSMVLMERAALSVVEMMESEQLDLKRCSLSVVPEIMEEMVCCRKTFASKRICCGCLVCREGIFYDRGDKASETDRGPLWSTCKRTGRRRLLYGDRGCNFWNWIIKTGFRDNIIM